MVVCLSMVLAASFAVVGSPARGAVDGKYYFTGEPADQANKAEAPTATFSKEAPTGDQPISQVAHPNCNTDFQGNPLCAFWEGDYTGTLKGNLEICWFWTSTNPAAVANGATVEVTVWAEPVAAEVVTTNLGRAEVELTVGPTPTSNVSVVPVNGTVSKRMMISVAPVNVDTGQGLTVQYGSTETPSAFAPPGQACESPAGTASPTGSASSSPSSSPSTDPGEGGGDHPRTLTMKLGHRGEKLLASGTVRVNDGYNQCRTGVRVKLERKKASGWRMLTSDRTNNRGRYEIQVVDIPGRYRATAVRHRKGPDRNEVCLPASKTVRHTH